jgi:amidase
MTTTLPLLDEPTEEEVREIAERFYMDLSDEEIGEYTEMIAGKMGGYERIEALAEPPRPLADADRDPGHRPDDSEDPLNAYVTACRVDGAEDGPLAGWTVGLKDNIALAGVEMTLGSTVMRGYVPDSDATVARRVLDAGATITGKTNMDSFAVSGTGELTATGPVLNPHDEDYLAGGSSSGSAAAVADGDLDLAFGTDQAGSVRVPAAWCGCVGHKPTFGLVPYTGGASRGFFYDHIGPLASSVADCATALDVVAGADDLDPRQGPGRIPTGEYEDALPGAAEELTVGVLSEGFGADEERVDDVVAEALDDFEAAGATVTEVSVPWHDHGSIIWSAVTGVNSTSNERHEGVGRYMKGHYDTQFLQAYANARRARADDLPPTVKLSILSGQWLDDRYHGYYHAKAQNLTRKLTRKYDEALESVDVLAMPTTPVTAFPVVSEYEDRTELIQRAQGKRKRGANTMAFNATGHPALSVPAGTVDDLPVGLMFVGEHFDDGTVLRAGDAFERNVDWESLTL